MMTKQRLALVAPALLAAAAVGAAESARFTYAPPNGLEYTERIRTVATRSAGEQAQPEDVSETVTRYKVVKTAQGYLIHATPSQLTMTRNGRPVESPLPKLLVGRTITYQLSPTGALQELRGYEKLLADVQKSFPPEVQKALAAALSPEALRRREEAEWSGRISSLVGKTVRVGEQWKSEDRFPLPTGPVTFHTVTTVPAIRDEGKRRLVTLRYAYDTDAAAAGQMAEKLLKGFPGSEHMPPIKFGKMTVTGHGERIINANTMFILSEKLQRVIRIPVEVPGQGQVLQTRTESKEYQYTVTSEGGAPTSAPRPGPAKKPASAQSGRKSPAKR